MGGALIKKSRACLIKKLFKALYRLENNRWENAAKQISQTEILNDNRSL